MKTNKRAHLCLATDRPDYKTPTLYNTFRLCVSELLTKATADSSCEAVKTHRNACFVAMIVVMPDVSVRKQ